MKPSPLTYKLSAFIKSDLFWVLLVCFTVRNIFHILNPGMPQNTDSVTYHYAAQNIFKGIIDASRTPVYPILMRISELISSSHPFRYLVVLQHVVSFLSIVPFFLLATRLINHRVVRNVLTAIYGCFPTLLFYNYALFPEAIFIASLVFFMYLFSVFVQVPTKGKAITINLFLFFMVMIKPVSLVFYGVMAFMWLAWFWDSRDRKLLKSIAFSFLAAVILLGAYCGLNKVQNNYGGLTSISHDNQFINVIFSGAYREIPDKDFITAIDTTLYQGHYYTIFYLNNDHDKYQKSFEDYPLAYRHQHDMWGIFIIPSNELGYTANNIAPYLKKATLTWTYIKYLLHKPIDFARLKFFSINGLVVYILILLDIIVIAKILIRKKTIDYLRILNLLMLLGLLLAFFVGGVIDGTYPRVLLPIFPFVMAEIFLLTDSLIEGMQQAFTRSKIQSNYVLIKKRGRMKKTD